MDAHISPASQEPSHSHNFNPSLLAAIILISVLFGIFGGVWGALYFAKLPAFQQFFGSTTSSVQSTVERGVYKEDSAIIDVVKQSSPAVVSIVISEDLSKLPQLNNGFFTPFFGFSPPQSSVPNIQQVGAGSGFFVTSDGLIITNKHVVSNEQASYTVVTTDNKSYPAQVVARDPVNDLAILKIDISNAPTLLLSDSNQIQIGQQVVAIGNSLGEYQNTVTSGIVSGIGRSIVAGGGREGSEQLEGVIQTDAAINPGNSGGPLLNLAGQVIGINTAVDQQGQLVGFALPSNLGSSALVGYQKAGKISRPFLGVHYTIVTKSLVEQQKLARDFGAWITRGFSTDSAVVPGSPADKAGLKEDDIILEVNGHRIDESNTLSRELKNYNTGDSVNLKVYSGGNEKTVTVILGEAQG